MIDDQPRLDYKRTAEYAEKMGLRTEFSESSAPPTGSKAITLTEGTLKEIATDFFRWWNNQPGANTDQGFDEWLRLNRARFGL